MASILVCDDEPLVVELLSSTFESHGYLVPVARNGSEAITLTKLHRPDLLLLDVHLPDMSGIDVLRKIRALPKRIDTSAVFLSGIEDPAVMEEARALGAVDYITKQAMRTGELLKTVERHTTHARESSQYPIDPFEETLIDDLDKEESSRLTRSSAWSLCHVAGWILRQKLGRGSMGDVYVAQKGAKRVAAKILPRHQDLDSDVASRFQREIRVLQSLQDPHIVEYLDSGFSDSRPYLLMGLVRAPNLQSYLDLSGGTITLREAYTLIAQVGSALARAWEAGITHRDIKPANILIAPPRPKKAEPFCAILCDFGLARIKEFSKHPNELSHHTPQGIALGTPTYMSPEQVRGISTSDQRQDIYGLGATLHKALTGQRLFGNDSQQAMVRKASEDPDLSALFAIGDRKLSELLADMLQRDPERRISNWQEVLQRIA